jgi:hypothetical protein
MLDTLKAGQNIRCTVSAIPAAQDHIDTIFRLMRQDMTVQKALKKSQTRRLQTMNVYNRGNRDWTSRQKVGKIVEVEKGRSWTMPYFHQIAPDLKSVQKFLSIVAA